MEVFLEAVHRLIAERQREAALAERDRAISHTAVWALNLLAQGDVEATGRKAAHAARRLGLPPLEVQAAVLMARLHEEVPPFLIQALPPSVRALVTALLAPEDDPAAGLQAQIGRALLGHTAPPALFEVLQEEPPAEAEEVPRSRSGRALIWLGKALEEAGETANARKAYQDVLRLEQLDLERLEALLGLARLGELDYAAQAVEQARRLGPLAAAATALEAATLAPDLGQKWIEEAGRTFLQLGVTAGEAQARLLWMSTRADLDPAALKHSLGVLLSPAAAPELAASVRWLLPWLLGQEPHEEVQRALRRLATQFPRELHRVVTQTELSVPARRLAAQILPSHAGEWVNETRQHLARDQDAQTRGSVTQRTAESPEIPLLRLCSLGTFQVWLGEEAITHWRTQKARLLLALLAAHPGKSLGEDMLIETFWGDSPKGKLSLYSAVSYLRSALRVRAGEPEGYVIRQAGQLSLNPEAPIWSDFAEFDAAYARGRTQTEPERRCREYRAMYRLYKGPYMEGCYLDWALVVRGRVEAQMLEMLAYLCQHGGPEEARECSQRMLELDPCHQEAGLFLMQAWLSLGRPEEAVRAFQKISGSLQRDLQMEPSTELLRAHQQARLLV